MRIPRHRNNRVILAQRNPFVIDEARVRPTASAVLFVFRELRLKTSHIVFLFPLRDFMNLTIRAPQATRATDNFIGPDSKAIPGR